MSEKTPCMKTRLERVALCADIASHYVQDMRVMPASGVARVAWDSMDHIDALEAERNKLLHRATIAEEWRDSDRQRAIDAESKLAKAVGALEQCQTELDQYSAHEYPGEHPVQARYRKRDYDANPARIALAAIKGASAPITLWRTRNEN